jgi:hypothetical protein
MKTVTVNYSYIYTTEAGYIQSVHFEARDMAEALSLVKALRSRIPIRCGTLVPEQRVISTVALKNDAIIYLPAPKEYSGAETVIEKKAA